MSDSDFSLKYVPGVQFYLFLGCFRIKILSPIHLDTWMIFINNLKRLKNAKNACADIQKEQCSLSWNEYSLLRPATQVMPELCHLCTELRLHWTLFALDFVCTGLCLKLFWFQEVSPLNPWQGPECALSVTCMSAPAFFALLRHFRFLMGMIQVSRWIGLEILILKHPWKSKIGPLEQILG